MSAGLVTARTPGWPMRRPGGAVCLQMRVTRGFVRRAGPAAAGAPGQDFGGGVLRRIEYNRCSVRSTSRSPASAGEASAMSSSSFTCSN